MSRTMWIAAACSVLAGLAGYAAGAAGSGVAPAVREAREDLDESGAGSLEDDGAALAECEARLASSEVALAQRPPIVDGPTIDVAALPEQARLALESPEVSRAIEIEVERRIGERFERERARRQEEWAQRRAETRERLRAIGIDDATLARVSPAMCAIRDVYRQAWSGGRGGGGAGGGDAGARMGRREIREATRELRDEVTTTLGDELSGRLEEEGGLRALGGAVDCGESVPGPGGRGGLAPAR